MSLLGKREELLAGLARGESLPARWYTAPAVAEREIERLFRRSWHYMAPLSELAAVGDYVTGHVGSIPVVVLRNEAGLAAFVNVCRHRRHEVMKGRGNARTLRCGYHAWTYDLAGGLRAAPRTAAEPGFRVEDYPLLPLRVETLGPWAFINADAGAPPLVARYGGLPALIERTGIDLGTLRLHSRTEWDSDANWKTMLENYLECYHCPIAHPGFSAAIDVRPDAYRAEARGWILSQAGRVRDEALAGRARTGLYDVRGDVAEAQYHLLFPNLTLNVNPGFPNLSLDVWMPDGPGRTKGFSEQYFAPGVDEGFARDLIEFNRQVGEEDDVLTSSVQRGLAAGIPERGRFLTGAEELVGRFQRMVVEAVLG
ncbi:MAG: aromatic ring-hydroxylating dioxygenase subunit alpha [Enhydrobacter sp.]|nr:MAG: aromatic ring-hydroxylating dioxygenase subunit alpha [Enhydrobacter sp.]